MTPGASPLHREAEQAARQAYGRLLAYTARRTHELAAAEDALADAFVAALETWPRRGVPANPEAWLLTAARNRLTDSQRHHQVRDEAQPVLEWLAEQAEIDPTAPAPLPDERLHMLFLCAHPAIDGQAHTPLMLQAVLGLDAARIASAFLVAPATMSQRLVRAKRKISEARIDFELPEGPLRAERLEAVLEAIYAAYGTGWEDPQGADARRAGLAEEALFLARLLAELLPEEPEVLGLLALICHCEARREARRDAEGRYVPLAEQDPQRWSRALIAEAQQALDQAARQRS
ncbi:MAG TPA: DUF6596 domain-containing protein, partial [Nevskiaceae bacterium]|nr:DUF6596 domain-containing protein [Nevskiaceae bacterium]